MRSALEGPWRNRSTTDRRELLEAGRAALALGAWGRAASAFHRVVSRVPEASREGAEAWAGIGLASYWLGAPAEATTAHERAFRLYGELGEPLAAARSALWLADAQFAFFGAHAVANGWIEQAGRLLEDLPASPEHAWLLAYRGHYALDAEGDAAGALALARRGRELARSVPAPEAEVVLVAVEGLALVMLGEVREGMARLDEASAAAVSREPGDLNAVAWACCYLIHGCRSVRDLPRAAEWCGRVMAFCERWGLAPVYAACRVDHAVVLTWRGRWSEAEAELERALGDGASMVSPTMERAWALRLADLRRRQGRLEEAEALFLRAGEDFLALVGTASLALDGGEPAVALDLCDRVLRLLPQRAWTERVDALLVRVRAAAAAGDLDRAGADAAELAATAERVGTDPLRAAAAFARGVVADVAGDAGGAARAYEEAVVHHDRGGMPYEGALARLELAAALARLGRRATARREVAHARAVLASLGAARDLERAESVLRAWDDAARGPGHPLTPREVEVLRLLAAGLNSRRVAKELFISPHTVKRHVTNILRKLDSSSRAAAVARAGRLGLL